MSATHASPAREAGGIASFIIVGIVLLALVLGGVFFARQRGNIASNDNANPTPVAGNEDKNPGDSGANAPVKDKPEAGNTGEIASPQQNDQGGGQRQDTNQGTQPQRSEEIARQPAAGQGSGGQSEQQPAQAPATGPTNIASTGPSGQAAAPSDIPATGLAENIAVASLGLASLTLAGLKYYQARRRFLAGARQQ